jgi:hypothetical protein
MDSTKFLKNNVDTGQEKSNGKDSVLIYFGAFNGLDEIHKLDRCLYDSIPLTIGRHDGHEVAIDDTNGTLFTYGYNAETLYKTMQPILNEFDFLIGATVHLSFVEGRDKPLELEFEFEKRITN